jgi:hypothetical protein
MQQLDYLMNDPTTPDLHDVVNVPSKPCPGINVVGWSNLTNTPVEKQAAGCYVTLGNAINYTQVQQALAANSLKKWAAVKILNVYPRRGQQLNAYYDRRGLSYFYDYDSVLGKMVYAADSVDVVAHECGHALLDAARPDFWSVQAVEIWSFHEAYADITAIVTAMQQDKVLRYMLEQTGNDISKSNIVSRLAEQLGKAIYDLTEGRGGYSPNYLRDAVNTFKWVLPASLPSNADDTQLANECHSFGRVFLGAWYDILVGFFNYEKTSKLPLVALKNARDRSFLYLLKAIKTSPRTTRYYQAVANNMLAAAKKDVAYQQIMATIFNARKILPQTVKSLSINKSIVQLSRSKSATIHKMADGGKIVLRKNPVVVSIADNFSKKIIAGLSVGKINLADLKVELAMDDCYEFDSKGQMVSALVSDKTEAIEDAKQCLAFIQTNKAFGKEHSMWQAEKGKLVRAFID